MKLKLIIAAVSLIFALLPFSVAQLQKMALKEELASTRTELALANAQLAVANANVTASNAVIDRQNAFIAALENKLAAASILAEAQIEEIRRISDIKRAAVHDMPADETLDAVHRHLTEFFNG